MIFLLVGFMGGAALVGLAWIGWWHWESSRPIHCAGCACVSLPDADGRQF